MISVTQVGETQPLAFEVAIDDGDSQSRHEVTIAERDLERLAGRECPAGACVEAAFRFLLDREPKEAIFSRFDIMVIPRYFTEFERELPGYIAQGADLQRHGAGP
jgi:hypothetical protein